jgi:hypothetical protein
LPLFKPSDVVKLLVPLLTRLVTAVNPFFAVLNICVAVEITVCLTASALQAEFEPVLLAELFADVLLLLLSLPLLSGASPCQEAKAPFGASLSERCLWGQ